MPISNLNFITKKKFLKPINSNECFFCHLTLHFLAIKRFIWNYRCWQLEMAGGPTTCPERTNRHIRLNFWPNTRKILRVSPSKLSILLNSFQIMFFLLWSSQDTVNPFIYMYRGFPSRNVSHWAGPKVIYPYKIRPCWPFANRRVILV